MQTVKLNTGDAMPVLGFGTWKLQDGRETFEATLAALKAGYRLIDTAKIYGNETSVGNAIRESGVPREEIFVTTKLWNDDQGFDSALQACNESLQKLGLDYIDLYLIHWPASEKRHDSWEALTQLYKTVHAKAIGVSNYTIEHLKELQERSPMLPAVNQIEFQPFNYARQKELLDYCKRNAIVVEAYSPLAQASDMDNPVLGHIANRLKKSVAQVMLRWCVQKGTVPIPKSSNKERIKENMAIFDFELTVDDMAAIDALGAVSA